MYISNITFFCGKSMLLSYLFFPCHLLHWQASSQNPLLLDIFLRLATTKLLSTSTFWRWLVTGKMDDTYLIFQALRNEICCHARPVSTLIGCCYKNCRFLQQVMLRSLQLHRFLRHLSVRCFVIPPIFLEYLEAILVSKQLH